MGSNRQGRGVEESGEVTEVLRIDYLSLIRHGRTGMNQSSEPATSAASSLRPEIQRIISQGAAPAAANAGSPRSVVGLTSLSMLLLWLSFTPVELSFFAWISLVPLSQLLRLKSLPRLCYRAVYLVACVWAVVTLQWMRLGHPAMYLALAALAFYVAMYIPAFVWLGRRCVSAGVQIGRAHV